MIKVNNINSDSREKELYLNEEQFQVFGLKSGQKITLQIGFNTLLVKLSQQNTDFSLDNIYLSSSAYGELIHYHGQPLWLAFKSEKLLVLGPTVGITVSMPTWKKLRKKYAILKRALLALEKGIFFFCFHLSKVNLDNSTIEAYCLNPISKEWERKALPFPQVLYHRATYPFYKYKEAEDTNNLYHKLWLNPNLILLNSAPSFNKWKVYEALSSFENTTKLQPESALLTFENLKKFLSKYNSTFAKGKFGRCGRQVLQVAKEGEKFFCRSGGSKVKEWQFETPKELYIFLLESLGKEVILQQGITLARINNRPFDIRVLVQKDIKGTWVISALSFRIADPAAIVTNIAAGAEEICVSLEDNFYPKLSPSELTSFCQKVLSALESHYGTLGEVGLDIAIDTQDNLWLLEANSQPSSRGYKEAATDKVCDLIFGLPLDYSKFLVQSRFQSLFDSPLSQE